MALDRRLFSNSYRAQRLELLGVTLKYSDALDALAAREPRTDAGVIFFHRSTEHLSPDALADFEIAGLRYTSVSEYMRSESARAGLVRPEVDGDVEAQGRWSNEIRRIAYEATAAKFLQNAQAKAALFESGTAVLGFSESEPFWGTGLDAAASDANRPQQWPGHNWMGIVLMLVREDAQAFARIS